MATTTTESKIVALRVRAFGGRLEACRCMVDTDGTVRVYDAVAGYYTTCHSLSPRDLGRVRRAAARM